MGAGADIVVLGGGIAGCVAARGFAGAGMAVALLTACRRHRVYEGLSERAAEGLRAAGCVTALAAVGPWVARTSHWNGETRQVNGETLVERRRFDAALLDDARAAGVKVHIGRIQAAAETADGWRVSLRGGDGARLAIDAGFLVEARGRRAPGGGRRRHGPSAVALVGFWKRPPAAPALTAVAAFADGWAWLAAPGDDNAALQVVVAGDSLPGRADLERFYGRCVDQVTEAASWLAGAERVGAVVARNADVLLAPAVLGERWIRIGDAAFAVDPLSGHGQFAAISTALNAVPVVATVRERPADAALAKRFYGERVETAFLTQGRVGRDFYRLEQRWAERPFWSARRAWPDDEPAHPRPAAAPPRIARRPVIAGGYVVEREVVVTADHARGVWQVAGVALAPLMRFLDGGWRAAGELVPAAAAHLECPAPAVETALGWLVHRGLLVARHTS